MWRTRATLPQRDRTQYQVEPSWPKSCWYRSGVSRAFIASRYSWLSESCVQESPDGQLPPDPLQGCEQNPPLDPCVARQAKLSHSLEPRYRYWRPGCGISSAPAAFST